MDSTSYFIEIELYFANLDCQEPHIVLTHNCLQTLRVSSCLQIKLFILDLFRDVPISWPGSVGQRKQEAAHSEIFALDLSFGTRLSSPSYNSLAVKTDLRSAVTKFQ